MAIVTIKNLSSGLRSFQNTQRQTKTFKPGETRTMEIAPSHVDMLEREAKKPNATVAITMAADERELHNAEMKEIGKANRASRVGARTRVPGQPVPPKERPSVVDKRFFVDPETVKQQDSAELGDQQERDAEEEAEAVRLAVEAGSKKKVEEPEKKKGKPKVERVPLKKKKEE